jgi:serine/threonine protein kinase
MREAHVLRDCAHPALAKVIDEGTDAEGSPFFVMEYFHETLQDILTARRTLPVLKRLEIVGSLLSAIQHLASRTPCVVHRDIKPSNIFIDGSRTVLGDFGILFHDASTPLLDGARRPFARQFPTPELVAYANGGPPPTSQSDVFQLGLIAGVLFTGLNPITDTRSAAVSLGPALISERDSVPRESVDSLLQDMLKPEPEDRPSINELLARCVELICAASEKPARELAPDWVI